MKNKNIPCRFVDIEVFDGSVFEKIKTRKLVDEPDPHYRKNRKFKREDGGFKCVSCKNWVNSSRESSGVNNRNHCPLCLVSLHVDLIKAGDRRATCRSRMVAIGLTFKKVNKRYPGEEQGELMLIHRCAGCGKININRVAGDDNPELLYGLSKSSLELSDSQLAELTGLGIQPLDSLGFNAAYTQIFGRQPIAVALAEVRVEAVVD
jgi:hypothetical protein